MELRPSVLSQKARRGLPGRNCLSAHCVLGSGNHDSPRCPSLFSQQTHPAGVTMTCPWTSKLRLRTVGYLHSEHGKQAVDLELESSALGTGRALWAGPSSVLGGVLVFPRVWYWDWGQWPLSQNLLGWKVVKLHFYLLYQEGFGMKFWWKSSANRSLKTTAAWKQQQKNLSYKMKTLVCIRTCLMGKKLGNILLLSLLQKTYPENIPEWPD